MTQQHHEEAESGSEGEGEASARRSASDLRAAGINGVGSGDGIEAGSSARLDGPHDGDDGENGSGDGYSEGGDKGSGPNGTPDNLPRAIEIRGARVHNLRGIDLDVPLHRLVGIAGVSGSGKSSLALGILYAEGSRRYLEALSTYTRRRMTSAAAADVESIEYVPAALALHQRPAVPGIRSTFGTQTELLNSLRLMFSRLGSHRCPNGHAAPPTINVAAERPIVCPECGAEFFGPSAEQLAFNGEGACPACSGTGTVREVNRDVLVPDESLTIEQGAVAPWNQFMWSLMTDVVREMGVRTDVPFSELTPEERRIVFDGPAEKRHILYKAKKTDTFAELDFTYFNAVYTVENALAKAKDEKGLARVSKFLVERPCPACGGSRLNERARTCTLAGKTLPQAAALTLEESVRWVAAVPSTLPPSLAPMANSIAEQYLHTAQRLMDLGLGYLALDRAGATLSTGERQRVQLARAVRNRTTGVLYVLDEPSIGLHPSNIDGLLDVARRPFGPWQLGRAGGPRRAHAAGGRLDRRDGSRRGARRRHRGVPGRRGRRAHEPRLAHRPVFGQRRACPRAREDGGRPPVRRRDHPPVHRAPAYGACARPGAADGPAGGRHGRVGLGQDHARAGKPGARPGGAACRRGAAQPCARARRRGRDQGAAHRRHAHRGERAFHRGHLLERARRPAQALRRHFRGAKARPDAQGLLVQHGLAALPRLRRHGTDIARRAVPARRGHRMRGVPRLPLRARG